MQKFFDTNKLARGIHVVRVKKQPSFNTRWNSYSTAPKSPKYPTFKSKGLGVLNPQLDALAAQWEKEESSHVS